MKKAEYIEKYGEEAYREMLIKKRERDKQYYQSHKEKILEQVKLYYKENTEKVREYNKKYYLSNRDEYCARAKKWAEENPERHREIKIKSCKKWRENHSEHVANYNKEYKENNKDAISKYNKEYKEKNKEKISLLRKKWASENQESVKEQRRNYYRTKNGRAAYLAGKYKQADKKRGFDISNNVTSKWIVENIFSGQKCVYCGDQDWKHLGCDRMDNNKPHTADNCVCSCFICNVDRGNYHSVEEFKQYRSLHPRECDIPKPPAIQLSETGALKKRAVRIG